MVLSGESITAQQAQQAGLVSDVFPASLTLEYALKQAARMARHSPLALQAAKQALRQSQEVAFASRTCPGATVIHLAGGNRRSS
ncbi:enoyl-CoA hydratase-related protein [Enterobacter hormaechei]